MIDIEQRKLVAARAYHEGVRAYKLALGEEDLGPWDSLGEELRESSLHAVEGAINGNDARQQHEQWMKERIAAGWVYGAEKSASLRTNPCLVPYDQLPQEQRIKDGLCKNIVLAVGQAFEAAY